MMSATPPAPASPDPYAPSQSTKKQIAQQQVQNFQQTLFQHEMNLARLSAVAEATRDEGWAQSVTQEHAAIDTLRAAIDATNDAISRIAAGQPLPSVEPPADPPPAPAPAPPAPAPAADEAPPAEPPATV